MLAGAVYSGENNTLFHVYVTDGIYVTCDLCTQVRLDALVLHQRGSQVMVVVVMTMMLLLLLLLLLMRNRTKDHSS